MKDALVKHIEKAIGRGLPTPDIVTAVLAALKADEKRNLLAELLGEFVEDVEREAARRVEESSIRLRLESGELVRRGKRAVSVDEAERLDSQEWEYQSRAFAQIGEIMTAYASEVRLEVTAELLASVFALGDGREVTWGDATREDHQTRCDYINTMAVGMMKDSVRHLAAIAMIDEAGVSCLADLPKVAAA